MASDNLCDICKMIDFTSHKCEMENCLFGKYFTKVKDFESILSHYGLELLMDFMRYKDSTAPEDLSFWIRLKIVDLGAKPSQNLPQYTAAAETSVQSTQLVSPLSTTLSFSTSLSQNCPSIVSLVAPSSAPLSHSSFSSQFSSINSISSHSVQSCPPMSSLASHTLLTSLGISVSDVTCSKPYKQLQKKKKTSTLSSISLPTTTTSIQHQQDVTSQPPPAASLQPESPSSAPNSPLGSLSSGSSTGADAVPAPLPAAVPAPLPAAVPAPLPAAVPAPLPAGVPAPLPAAVPDPLPAAGDSTYNMRPRKTVQPPLQVESPATSKASPSRRKRARVPCHGSCNCKQPQCLCLKNKVTSAAPKRSRGSG